ncbi:hypothetical protein Tco_0953456 [Tanacetum coccineum]|uniref:Reverse transcriptase Ty1/copia-type domain-containing protein n=1 Tax=Tanacetum coccineum TaxID=301880 RepID=A0ABQ5E004_9ASTR
METETRILLINKGTPTDQTTYRHMIGGLMYLTASHPDIAFATFVCAGNQALLIVKHHKEFKRSFVRENSPITWAYGIRKDSGCGTNCIIQNADHAGCKDDYKSTSGGLQFLGGKLMSWSSKKQDCTAMSTAEAEYVSLSACLIIMAQQQHAADVHPDELCPPNKRYDLMDANKKVDLEHHLASEEIEKLVEGSENVIDDSSPPKNDEPQIPDTRLEPRSDKKSLEVERTNDEEVKKQVREQVRDQVPVYVAEGLILVRQETKEEMERMIVKAILQEHRNIQAEISSQIQKAIDNQIPSQVDALVRNNPQLQQQDIAIWLALQMKFENLQVQQTTCRPSAVRPRDQDDPHDDAHPEGENSAKRQKTSEYEAYMSGESSSGQVNEEERGPSTSGNQEQEDDYDFWTDSYASDDDAIPSKQVSQDIMKEVSLTIDETKLKKMADEMLRQRCTSGDEHQYHIDQMNNFLQSDIVWKSRKEILVSPHPRKTTPLDLEKIVLSLHKFPTIIFNDDDIEERTSKGVNKCVKKFNPYARYGVEHWKNPHAKIFYIRKQKDPGKPKEEIVARRANDYIVSITKPDYKNLNKNDIEDMYFLIMNGKVPDYAETGLLWSLSVFIRSSVIWEKVHDFQLRIESYQQKVNLTAPTISFSGVEKHRMFSIIYEPVHGIIYKNSKKEKRVMRHSEIHKFCDATLNRVLEGLKSYNNDVKYGYVQRELTNYEVEYLKLFEEEIKVRLKHRNQMRRWEMYVEWEASLVTSKEERRIIDP